MSTESVNDRETRSGGAMARQIHGRHTLVVTLNPERADKLTAKHPAHTSACFEYALECPVVTHRCRAWQICEPCSALDMDSEAWDELEQDGEAHGVEHQDIGGDWYTPTEDCLAVVDGDLRDAAEELQLRPGRHEVEVLYEHSEFLRLIPIERAAAPAGEDA